MMVWHVFGYFQTITHISHTHIYIYITMCYNTLQHLFASWPRIVETNGWGGIMFQMHSIVLSQDLHSLLEHVPTAYPLGERTFSLTWSSCSTPQSLMTVPCWFRCRFCGKDIKRKSTMFPKNNDTVFDKLPPCSCNSTLVGWWHFKLPDFWNPHNFDGPQTMISRKKN